MFRLFAIIMYIYIYIHLYKKKLFGSYLYLQCSATCFLRDNLFIFFSKFSQNSHQILILSSREIGRLNAIKINYKLISYNVTSCCQVTLIGRRDFYA